MAYLTMMTPRLLELHRVLKETGSIYLHCDPTASHYLKLVMDAIFNPAQFRNEKRLRLLSEVAASFFLTRISRCSASSKSQGVPKRRRYSCEFINPLTIERKSEGFALIV